MKTLPHYLIIGNGRVARHMAEYLSLSRLPYRTWDRSMPLRQLEEQGLPFATHILLLIRDEAIEGFAQGELKDAKAVKIHFSGSLVTEAAFGAHPLTTFGPKLYGLRQYQKIPFIVERTAPPFSQLLPALPNLHERIDPAMKAKYHALCVMAGNFSCMLWQKLFESLVHEMNIPAEMGFTYLRQQTENLTANYKTALTGPLARGDTETLDRHIAALEGDPFQDVYKSFVSAYRQKESE